MHHVVIRRKAAAAVRIAAAGGKQLRRNFVAHLEMSLFPSICLYHFRFLFVWRVCRTFCPSEACFTGPHAFGPKKIHFVPKILMKQPYDCSY